MYKNKNKNTRDNATQPANATRTVYYEELKRNATRQRNTHRYYEELDELQLERWSAACGALWPKRKGWPWFEGQWPLQWLKNPCETNMWNKSQANFIAKQQPELANLLQEGKGMGNGKTKSDR